MAAFGALHSCYKPSSIFNKMTPVGLPHAMFTINDHTFDRKAMSAAASPFNLGDIESFHRLSDSAIITTLQATIWIFKQSSA